MLDCSLLLKTGEQILKKNGILTSRLDSEVLLSSIAGKDRLELVSKENLKVSNEQALHYQQMIERRKKKEPIAYIIKRKEFFNLPFFVNSYSLIPRPETELLVERILRMYKNKKLNILDVGTGSGCMILSLLKSMPNARGVGLEISKNAIGIAKINAKKILKDRIFKVKFAHNSIQNFCSKKHFDVIISNPPYIPTYEIKNLSDDVKNFEPKLALDGGKDGLDVIKKVIYKSRYILKSQGLLALEIGNGQYFKVSQILKNNFFRTKYLIKDFKNNIRCILSELNFK